MAEDSENRGDFAGVARHRDKEAGVMVREDRIERGFGPDVLCGRRLTCHAGPQLVVLCETALDGPVREQGMDVGAVAPPIACVDADAFAEEFFDQRLKRGTTAGKSETREGDIGRLEGAREGTDEIAVWRVDMLLI